MSENLSSKEKSSSPQPPRNKPHPLRIQCTYIGLTRKEDEVYREEGMKRNTPPQRERAPGHVWQSMAAQLCVISHAGAMADYGLISQQLLHEYLS